MGIFTRAGESRSQPVRTMIMMMTIGSPYPGAGNYHVLVTRRFHQPVIFFNPTNQPAKPTDLKMIDGVELPFSRDKVL